MPAYEVRCFLRRGVKRSLLESGIAGDVALSDRFTSRHKHDCQLISWSLDCLLFLYKFGGYSEIFIAMYCDVCCSCGRVSFARRLRTKLYGGRAKVRQHGGNERGLLCGYEELHEKRQSAHAQRSHLLQSLQKVAMRAIFHVSLCLARS